MGRHHAGTVRYLRRNISTKKTTPPASNAVPSMTGLASVFRGAPMTWEGDADSGLAAGELNAMSQRPRKINPTATILSTIRIPHLQRLPTRGEG